MVGNSFKKPKGSTSLCCNAQESRLCEWRYFRCRCFPTARLNFEAGRFHLFIKPLKLERCKSCNARRLMAQLTYMAVQSAIFAKTLGIRSVN